MRQKNNNDSFINKLRTIYSEGNLVPFIGAGLSVPFKVPDWKTLIMNCAEEKANKNDKVSLEYLKNRLEKNEYWDAIKIMKEDLKCSEEDIQSSIVNNILSKIKQDLEEDEHNYLDLNKEKFNIYLTTNYDDNLYKYIKGNLSPISLKDINENIQEILSEKKEKRIIHLHGRLSDKSSIVISKEKYLQLYNNRKYKLFFSTFSASKTFIFLGFSFDDIFIQKIIKENNKLLKSKHYIILSNPTEEQKDFLNSCGINTIVYDHTKSSHHKEIRKVLKKICENVRNNEKKYETKDQSTKETEISSISEVGNIGMISIEEKQKIEFEILNIDEYDADALYSYFGGTVEFSDINKTGSKLVMKIKIKNVGTDFLHNIIVKKFQIFTIDEFDHDSYTGTDIYSKYDDKIIKNTILPGTNSYLNFIFNPFDVNCDFGDDIFMNFTNKLNIELNFDIKSNNGNTIKQKFQIYCSTIDDSGKGYLIDSVTTTFEVNKE